MNISDKEFDEIISSALDELPQKFIQGLNNVVITYENEPSQEQRVQLQLRCNQSLFGLYEGIPLTKRPSSDSMLSSNVMRLPDKITIFKNSILRVSRTREDFAKQVKHTLWHEIAHYYGLDHKRIHAIERGEV